MTTGTLSAGICFPTQLAAARNECSAAIRSVGNYYYSCEAILGSPSTTAGGDYLMSFSQRYQNGTTFSSTSVSRQLVQCELEDYWPMPISANNGLLIGAAVAGVWLLAWVARALVETLRADEGGE